MVCKYPPSIAGDRRQVYVGRSPTLSRIAVAGLEPTDPSEGLVPAEVHDPAAASQLTSEAVVSRRLQSTMMQKWDATGDRSLCLASASASPRAPRMEFRILIGHLIWGAVLAARPTTLRCCILGTVSAHDASGPSGLLR